MAFIDLLIVPLGSADLAAIKKWSDEKIYWPKDTLEIVVLVNSNGKTIVTLKVDGNLDKSGLPDPSLRDFHFTIDTNKIAALNIRLAGEGHRT